MGVAAVVARIRQLCCLNSGGRAAIPLLLSSLHELTPSVANAAFWLDPALEVTSSFAENPVPQRQMELYLAEYCNKREGEVIPPLRTRILQSRDQVRNSERFDTKRLVASDFYRDVIRPSGSGRFLEVAIMEGCRHPVYLTLSRPIEERPFKEEEVRNLQRLVPDLAHAFSQTDLPLDGAMANLDSALLLLDPNGRILHRSAQAAQLLHLFGEATYSAGKASDNTPALPILQELARRLTRLRRGLDEAVPAITRRNSWGSFTFRGYWLDSDSVETASLIAVEIHRAVPLPVRLFQQLGNAPLSPRQREVCLLLLSTNLSQTEIAERLGLSRSTVIDYTRLIYEKMEVSGRGELLARLLPA